MTRAGTLCLVCAALLCDSVVAQNSKILFLVNDKDNLQRFDVPLKLRLEWQHAAEVTVESGNTLNSEDLSELALQHDMVLISETLGSTSVLEDGIFKLQETAVPVISFEAYMWEDAFWTELPQFTAFGNTGRTDLENGPEADGLEETQTDLYITAEGAAHPMGAGFAEGALTIHTIPYSVNFGTPSPDATVIATADADGKYPAHYVYDEGDRLVDNSVVPATRIALFVGQAANPNANFGPEVEFFTEDGLALLDAAIAYAVGSMPLPGDVNLDGNVDMTDFASIRDEFFTEGMTRADVNHDTLVNFEDFGIWKTNAEAGAPGTDVVPESSSSALLALGILTLSFLRRCRYEV